MLDSKRTISCEFFPPKTADGMDAVFRAVDRLQPFNPDFVSVTYGAGGSTRGFTEEIVTKIKSEARLEVMAHQTCVGQTQEEVHDSLSRLEAAGIENVIALRGDLPQGDNAGARSESGFSHASDLIGHINGNFNFGVAAACYPEGHTESVDLDADMEHTKLRVTQGADFLITQLFYDNNHYFDFVERAQKSGISVPILPGVLPILTTSQVRRFTALCGAKIPPELDKQLDTLGDDDDAVRDLGVEHATLQVRELWDAGVPGVHFYVLNRSYSVSNILVNLGLRGHSAQAGE